MALWGKLDQADNAPKFTAVASTGETGVDAYRKNVEGEVEVLGVSVLESGEGNMPAINTPGWVTSRTYIDAQGNTRWKSEVLVAMSSISDDGYAGTLADDVGEV